MKIYKNIGIACCLCMLFSACAIPTLVRKEAKKELSKSYKNSQDSTNNATMNWKEYFTDQNLIALIDTALKNNQSLNITLWEIQVANNEVKARRGAYLPFVDVGGGAGIEKTGRYTSRGASEANIDIKPGRTTPEILPNFMVGIFASWEVDIWRKLRNSKKAAALKYLATIEGKNFQVTSLISEIATAYYELLAYDNELAIIIQNIAIQENALLTVKSQKEAAKVTELAVKRFEAQLLNTKGLQFEVQQKIVEAENTINFLVGRYPQPIVRDAQIFSDLVPKTIYTGIPSQLLRNRPDIKQAELQMQAAKLDIAAAKASFYPSLKLSAGLGLQAFNPAYLAQLPESLFLSLGGSLMGPVMNRLAIKAAYGTANARQIQTVYDYERTVLNAYIEVFNQLNNIDNLKSSYDLKFLQVQALTESLNISGDLFLATRANYMEILLTQRDVLEARFQLVEIKMRQLHAIVHMYKALGGGWR